jgi:hypothetical protein
MHRATMPSTSSSSATLFCEVEKSELRANNAQSKQHKTDAYVNGEHSFYH